MTSVSRYNDLTGTNFIAESNYAFDEAGRLTNLVHFKDTTILAAYAWVYDAANRITQYTAPDGVSDYNYDYTDQLLDAVHDFQADENYSYDENGNRIKYETFKQRSNPQNPNPWESDIRFDLYGSAHFNHVTKQKELLSTYKKVSYLVDSKKQNLVIYTK